MSRYCTSRVIAGLPVLNLKLRPARLDAHDLPDAPRDHRRLALAGVDERQIVRWRLRAVVRPRTAPLAEPGRSPFFLPPLHPAHPGRYPAHRGYAAPRSAWECCRPLSSVLRLPASHRHRARPQHGRLIVVDVGDLAGHDPPEDLVDEVQDALDGAEVVVQVHAEAVARVLADRGRPDAGGRGRSPARPRARRRCSA